MSPGQGQKVYRGLKLPKIHEIMMKFEGLDEKVK